MKFSTKLIIMFYQILIVIYLTNNTNLRAKIANSQVDFYSNVEYENPTIIHHETPIYVHTQDNHDPYIHHEMVHHEQYTIPRIIQNSLGDIVNMDHLDNYHINHNDHINKIHPMDNCLCAIDIKCHPCGEIMTHHPFECHCAPKMNCPICPPLSLIHEIAAKKVIIMIY